MNTFSNFSADDLQHHNNMLLEKHAKNQELMERIEELEKHQLLSRQIAMNAHEEREVLYKKINMLQEEYEHRVNIVVHLKQENEALKAKINELNQVIERNHEMVVHMHEVNQMLQEQQVEQVSAVVAEVAAEEATSDEAETYPGQDMTDLKIIEGVGPKVEKALKAAGINNMYELSQKNEEELQTILSEADGNFGFAKPETWQDQASMAAAGKVEELKAWQAELKGGRKAKK